jgi:diguanylate cyclase (GGDEF)-like protein
MIGDVLAMLEVRASEELPGWVAERLGERTPRARTRVLNVYPARAARIKGMGSYEDYSIAEDAVLSKPTPVADDPALLEALRARRVYTLVGEGEDTRFIATFEARGEPRQVLDARGYGVGVHARDLISMARKYYERLVESETDPLTRLSNRRLFQAHVDAGIRRWVASGRGYYFAMLDLDRFKRINDDFGHLYGDEILVHFANLMRSTFRSADQLYRFGGEEFVVIFGVEPPEAGGEGTLERFRKAVETYKFPGVGSVTVSIGFARVADAATPAAILIDRADEALYYAKEHGRNRVCSWEALVAAGELKPKATPQADVTLF